MSDKPHHSDLLTKKFFLEHYIEKKMSYQEISDMLKEQGYNIVQSTLNIYSKKHGISRNMGQAALIRTDSPVNYDISYMDEATIEWVDGFLLGDGGIAIPSQFASRATCGLEHKEFAEYMMSGFKNYYPDMVFSKYKEPAENGNTGCWNARTRFHPDFLHQYNRWYRHNGEKVLKIVPEDVRITPTSVMLWYLGDGSYTTTSGTLRFSTDNFTKEEVEFLAEKLCEIGINCHRSSNNRVYVETSSFPALFSFIGKESPVSCYKYKFNIPEWKTGSISMRETASELGLSYNTLSYWVKIKRVPFYKENEEANVRFFPEHIEQIREIIKEYI